MEIPWHCERPDESYRKWLLPVAAAKTLNFELLNHGMSVLSFFIGFTLSDDFYAFQKRQRKQNKTKIIGLDEGLLTSVHDTLQVH